MAKNTHKNQEKNVSKKNNKLAPSLKAIDEMLLTGDYMGARKAVKALPDELRDHPVAKGALGKINVDKNQLLIALGTVLLVITVMFLTHDLSSSHIH